MSAFAGASSPSSCTGATCIITRRHPSSNATGTGIVTVGSP